MTKAKEQENAKDISRKDSNRSGLPIAPSIYAFGQFVNGQLGDRFSVRRFITLGVIVSALLFIDRPYPGQVIH